MQRWRDAAKGLDRGPPQHLELLHVIFNSQATGVHAASSSAPRVDLDDTLGGNTSAQREQTPPNISMPRRFLHRGETSASKRQKSRETMDYSVARFCDYMVEVEQRGDVPTTPGPVLTERA